MLPQSDLIGGFSPILLTLEMKTARVRATRDGAERAPLRCGNWEWGEEFPHQQVYRLIDKLFEFHVMVANK